MQDLLVVAKALNGNYVTESKPTVDIYEGDAEEAVALYYWGQESTPGIMAAWCIAPCPFAQKLNYMVDPLVPVNPQQEFGNLFPVVGKSPNFLHVTQTKFLLADGLGLAERLIRATGDDKEFGPGFYTMSPDALASGYCKRVADKWFSKSGQTWSVAGFQIPKQPNFWTAFLKDAAGNDVADLVFYLTNIQGHLRGGKNPDKQDVEAIERINLRGKALIFPNDDSDVKVPGSIKMKASDVSNQQGANLPGNPWIVIGPQRPECMLGARQVVWRYGLGLWLINSAQRFHVYRDK